MSDVLKTIDPAAFILQVGGVLIDGYADDGQVKIVKNEESFKLKVGTTGEGARMRNRNESGYIEIMLMQTSDSNDYLTSRHNADLAFGTGTFAISANDTLGSTNIDAINCYLEKMPDLERGNEVKTNTWRIVVPKLSLQGANKIGGNIANVDS